MTVTPAVPSVADAQQLTSDGSTFEILEYDYSEALFTSRYRGQIAGSVQTFEERIDFATTKSSVRPSEALLRLLALAVSLSYFKATRADTISVSFALTVAEKFFFQSLMENGLGEYAYVNDAAWKLTPSITAPLMVPPAQPTLLISGKRPLVAVGGGKDSIVTIEALKAAGHNPLLYSVNARGAILSSVAVSELDYITISRVIDPLLIELNRQGAPNGHIPVTAINSLIGLITAQLAESGPVIFSNEESADYGNLVWQDRKINHQWSKSFEYENLLRDTLSADGLSSDMFFSLLRSYRELEIARDFSRHPQYFDVFVSCNRGYRISPEKGSSAWCGECPKCAFVFLLLAPYISRSRLVEIFGKDLLDEPSQRERMKEILGLGEHKPFECVGEPAEAAEALMMVQQNGQWANSSLVQELIQLVAPSEGALNETHISNLDCVPIDYKAAADLIGLP